MIYTTLSNILASFYGNFALFFSIIPFLLFFIQKQVETKKEKNL